MLMKNLFKYISIAAITLLFVAQANAQRSFIGGGFTYMNRNVSGYDYTRKYSAMGATLTYTKYSSVRRGFALNVTPFLSGSGTYLDETLNQENELKSTGYGIGLSVFGLLGSDYQSKFEWGLINTAGFDVHPGAEFLNVSMDFGLMARYRLNSKIKIHASFSPVSAAFTDEFVAFRPVFGLQFLYAP